MARLQVEGLSKHFGATVAVRDVSLDVRDGEFVVLLGPSGCGKTTTLRMIAGFIAPTAGRVRLGGQDVTGLAPWKRNAGMVFQSYALFPHLTVAQNVAFGLEMRKVAKAEIASRTAEALRLVRLGGLSERLPRQLSGGSNSAWRWRARWSSDPTCSCWTSHSPIWTPSCGRWCAWRSASSSTSWASPP